MLRTMRFDRKSAASSASVPRIALVGCGAIASEYYVPALLRLPSVLTRLVLVDPDQERLQRIGEKLGVGDLATDYSDVTEEVDAVILAVPTEYHFAMSMHFLSHGKHVLCEKPLAVCASEARQMVAKAEETGAILAGNYLQRLIPSFAMVKRVIDDHTLGEVTQLKYQVGEEFKWPTKTGFYFNSSSLSSRGILRDRGAHVIDHICWWLGGKPTVVSCQNDSFGGSESVTHVEFKLGRVRGEVRLSWLSSYPCRYVVTCENGKIQGDVYNYRTVEMQVDGSPKRIMKLGSHNGTKMDIAETVVRNYVDSVKGTASPEVPGREVLDSISFIDDCYACATRFQMPWYRLEE